MTSFSKMPCARAIMDKVADSSKTPSSINIPCGCTASRSVEMNGNHVQDSRKHQDCEQRQMQDVPQRKQALVEKRPLLLLTAAKYSFKSLRNSRACPRRTRRDQPSRLPSMSIWRSPARLSRARRPADRKRRPSKVNNDAAAPLRPLTARAARASRRRVVLAGGLLGRLAALLLLLGFGRRHWPLVLPAWQLQRGITPPRRHRQRS